MEIKIITYFSIVAEDRAGVLVEINSHLKNAGVALEGIWGFRNTERGADVFVIPREVAQFPPAAREAGWEFTEGTCFRITGEDKTGALVDLLNKIAEENINLYLANAIAMGSEYTCYLWGDEKDVVAMSHILGVRSPLS